MIGDRQDIHQLLSKEQKTTYNDPRKPYIVRRQKKETKKSSMNIPTVVWMSPTARSVDNALEVEPAIV